MGVRITELMIQRTALADLNRVRVRLARAHEQASSGLRINRPSDDPSGAREATALRARVAEVSQLERNLERAATRLQQSEVVLQDAQNVLIRARELAVQGSNDTLDTRSRRLIAAEIEALHDQLLSVGNSRVSGSYLFSGYASTTPAFTVSGPFPPGGPAPTVGFGGDSNEIEVEIDSGVQLPTTLDGRRVFLGDGDGDGTPDAGREDLFDVVADLWQALQDGDRDATASTIDRIDLAQEQISVERSRVGARISRSEAARQALGQRELDLAKSLSEVQDADSVQVFSDLVREETLLQASLQATAQLVQQSLLDFLR